MDSRGFFATFGIKIHRYQDNILLRDIIFTRILMKTSKIDKYLLVFLLEVIFHNITLLRKQ